MGAVDHAAVGRGGARIVQGPAGIGKSALLAAATEYGRARGLRVVAVQASELESGVAFGVARQLLSAAALRAATATPLGDSSDPVAPVATLHAAVAEAAGGAPLLLCVDDLQWADAASLRFIAFHARRLGELPVALLLGLRTPLRSPAPRALADLLNAARDRVLRPDPLSPAASAALVRGSWSPEVGDALCAACHEATGGNPFLLTELVAALRQAGVAPTALAIPDALAIGARAVGPLVFARLERVPQAANAFARAAAVAAEVGSASLIAHLAGIEESAGEAALAALTAANVCAPGERVRFVHPLVRMAIRDGMAPAERTRLARAAADALAAAGDRDAAAAFLLALPTAGDAAVAAALGEAGLRARRDGAPDVAATLLARALDEPPADALRPELLLALGDARRLLGEPAALETLRDARALAEDPRSRAEGARSLALALLAQLHVAEAVALLDEAVAEAASEGETALAEELEVLAVNHAFWDPAALASRAAGGESPAAARSVASPRAGRARRVLRALDAVAACRPAAEAAELAEQGLASGELMAWEPALHCAGALVLTACGLTSAARVQLSALAAHAAGAGDMQAVRSARVLRAAATLADGDVAAAEHDARAALADADVLDGGGALLFPLLEVLLRQGRAEEAAALLREHGLLEPLPPVTPFNTILHARGRVLIATGAARAGLEDVLLAGTRQEAVATHVRAGTARPGPPPTRAGASTAAHARLRAAPAYDRGPAARAARPRARWGGRQARAW
ncbi:MAG TPA: AAA family ATPase, partial [Conexibacter sp.]|nr:AAA family ATPase [Conexibacter sp.]